MKPFTQEQLHLINNDIRGFLLKNGTAQQLDEFDNKMKFYLGTLPKPEEVSTAFSFTLGIGGIIFIIVFMVGCYHSLYWLFSFFNIDKLLGI